MKTFKYELNTETVNNVVKQTMLFTTDMDEDSVRKLMFVNTIETRDIAARAELEKLGFTYNPFRKPTWSERFKSWLSEVQ